MSKVCSSLAALAMIAMREGQYVDAARLLAQAAVAPDSEAFLEETLANNFVAECMVNSVSSSQDSLSESIAALSASLVTVDEENKQSELYGDDEFHSLSNNMDDNMEDDSDIVFDLDPSIDDEDEDEDETNEEEDAEYIPSNSSCLKLRRK